MELREWGISVTILEPGNITTPIWKKSKEFGARSIGTVPQNGRGLYREALGSFSRVRDRVGAWGKKPIHVARTVERVLAARRPRIRYLVGWDANLLGRIIPALPDGLRHRILRWYVLRR
jgi:NAD(P)-dependent dehydrogenase (short-subunit alcohol dehydrogenase family)